MFLQVNSGSVSQAFNCYCMPRDICSHDVGTRPTPCRCPAVDVSACDWSDADRAGSTSFFSPVLFSALRLASTSLVAVEAAEKVGKRVAYRTSQPFGILQAAGSCQLLAVAADRL